MIPESKERHPQDIPEQENLILSYEYHSYKDPKLKLIFHTDYLENLSGASIPKEQITDTWIHWHKNPELLLVLNGQMTVSCNGITRKYEPGEVAVINSNEMHLINPIYEDTLYHCLIVDSEICNIKPLPARSSNPEVISLYHKIASELQEEKAYYREAVTGYIKAMFSLLARENSDPEDSGSSSRKMELTKAAIDYMYSNFQNELSLKEISEALNLNKYYLSHIFKETTGKTVLEHLNYIRCSNALSMLSSGNYTVTQSAYASGFTNLSYFSKTYKKIIGNSPTSDIPSEKNK